MGRNTENVEIEKNTLQDLEYDDKIEKHWKWESHMVGHEIWGDTLRNVQNEKQKL